MKLPIEISTRYKKMVKVINRGALAISVILSLFTIPFPISLIIALVLAGISIAIEKVVFIYTVLHVNPVPTRLRAKQQVSVYYACDTEDDVKKPVLGLVYKTKTEAIEKYDHLKAIALDTKDENNNLVVSFVFEDDKRYTLFMYPRKDREVAYHTKDYFESTLEKGEKAKLRIMSFIDYYPTSFTGKGRLREVLDEFMNNTPYSLNTYYFQNGMVIPARKRPIFKYHMRILKRDDLDDKDIEKGFDWYDPT